MKKLITLFLLGCTSALTALAQGQTSKGMSASTALLIRDLKLHRNASELARSPLKQIYCLRSMNGQTYVSAFIKLNDQVPASGLSRYGFLPGHRSGNIVTGMIPVENLAALSGDAAVNYLEIGTPVQQKMDSVRKHTGVDLMQTGYQLPKKYQGKGVVVGIVDKGFDFTHPNFYDSAYSAYRIKRVWNQGSEQGNPPAGFSYGRELKSKSAILNSLSDAPTSHGSHVAGIAAGSGALTNGKYTGIAPKADIVMVNYSKAEEEPTFTNVNIADGISYIFDYAASVNKPCVVNLSLGSHIGPHDGSSIFDQYCDSLVGSGKILLGASGNEGGFNLYKEKDYGAADTLRTLLGWPHIFPGNNGKSIINVWGEVGKKFRISIKLFNKTTGQYENGTPFFNAANNGEYEFALADGDVINPDTTRIIISTRINALNSKPEAFVYIDNSEQDDTSRWVQIEIAGQHTRTQMWAADVLGVTFFTDLGLGAPLEKGTSESTMGEIGGTGKRIVTVGAYTIRTQFTDLAGDQTDAPFFDDLGDIASFSSKGPTADGRTKPDITAPGNVVISSLNRFDPEYDASNPFTTDAITDGTHIWYFGALFGTSMATPVVTGIVALWLEANPNLTPEQVKTILKNTAVTDSYTGAIPAQGSDVWGWGKVDAYGGIKTITDVKDVKGVTLFTMYPNPSRGTCNLEFPQTASDVHIVIYDLTGKQVYEIQYANVQAGSTRTINLGQLPDGNYVVRTSINGNQAIGKLILLK